jgi:glycosyltransferase involved in cell wall biosynthesis
LRTRAHVGCAGYSGTDDVMESHGRIDGRISVCMAAYNGSPFVREQLESILDQLGPSDEVIVVDDASTDDTPAVVEAVGDPRITLIRRTRNLGHVRAFEHAISVAAGRYIFLADQDDVWIEGRVAAMLDSLSRRTMVAGNFTILDDPLPAVPERRLRAADSGAGLKNLLGILAGRRAYFGSAMAFRRELVPILLPIPGYVEAHDLWLAIVGSLVGGVEHCEVSVLLRRLHGGNLTPLRRRSFARILVSRFRMLRAMMEIMRRKSRTGMHQS